MPDVSEYNTKKWKKNVYFGHIIHLYELKPKLMGFIQKNDIFERIHNMLTEKKYVDKLFFKL